MPKILCKNGRVWDGERFFFADVLTDGKTIQKIQADISDPADFLFDVRGKTVTAGLVDAHVHIRGISSDDIGFPAEGGALPFGVTAVADASAVQGDKALLNAYWVKACVFVCAEIVNNHARFTNALKMLDAYQERAVGIKLYFDVGDPQLRDETPLKEVVEFAAAHGLKVLVHSTGSPVPMTRLVEWLRAGDILTHAYHGGQNDASVDDYASLRRAKARGIVVDAGLAGHVHIDFEVFAGAVRAGLSPDVISSDITANSGFVRGGRYGLTQCMSIARTLGMTEEEIFKGVTTAAASSLKQPSWGRLEVGGAADFAVLEYADEGYCTTDLSGHTLRSDEGYRALLTVIDGEVVYRR